MKRSNINCIWRSLYNFNWIKEVYVQRNLNKRHRASGLKSKVDNPSLIRKHYMVPSHRDKKNKKRQKKGLHERKITVSLKDDRVFQTLGSHASFKWHSFKVWKRFSARKEIQYQRFLPKLQQLEPKNTFLSSWQLQSMNKVRKNSKAFSNSFGEVCTVYPIFANFSYSFHCRLGFIVPHATEGSQ